MFATVVLVPSAGLARNQTAVKISFDLPADDAERSLKQFSAQSGLEVLFVSESVAKIKTNAVRGSYTSREAIERMLAGTKLVAKQDEKTGAMRIISAVTANGQRESADSTPDFKPPAKNKKKTMRTKTPIAILSAWIALALAPVHAAKGADTESTTGVIEGRVLNAGNGKYLNNARVIVEGTAIETFTNEFGEYRLNNVPAGEARVRVSYTGVDPQSAAVSVTAGESAQLDISLTSRERYGAETVKLDAFVVTSQREFEASAIAINEQRFAPNIKTVLTTDAYGDVTEGNVGEFLKYLPGITVDYVQADVRTVSLRGFASQFTNMSLDGMRLTSAASAKKARVIELEQLSISNAARVEVTKVPTPDSPADSLGGNINLVSKSAFERPKAEFTYRAYLNFNDEETKLFDQTPGPKNKNSYKVLPGFDFTYTVPINKNLGIAITGLSSNQSNQQHRSNYRWNSAEGGGTATNPYPDQYLTHNAPKSTYRDAGSIRVDWKIAPHHVLTANAQVNYYAAVFGPNNIGFQPGNDLAPKSATGTAATYGPDFMHGATGRGSVVLGGNPRNKYGLTDAINAVYRYTGRDWRADAGAFMVNSQSWYRDLSEGHWSGAGASLVGVSRVFLDGITAIRPASITVLDSAGNSIDYTKLANYRLTTMRSEPDDGKARMKGGFVNLKRDLDVFSFPLSVKVGLDTREEMKDNRRRRRDYTFVGADGKANTADDSAAPYIDPALSQLDSFFGWPPFERVDRYKLADEFRDHPNYFQPAKGGAPAHTFAVLNSERVVERVDSAYLQLEAKFFNNRLGVVTGVRYEKTTDKGEGPLVDPDAPFLRNPDGTFVDGSPSKAGLQRVRKPEAGANNSLEQALLTHTDRGFRAKRDYDDYYPSLHLTYNVKDNFLARFAYARTIGRPDFSNIVPTINIDTNEAAQIDPTLSDGTIKVSNTGLKPWTANGYDLSLEYYFGKASVASASVFLKDIKDFWGTSIQILTPELATELGLDPSFVGWTVDTTVNVGDARISGFEFNWVQDLSFLPGWGRYFRVNANGTSLHLQGANSADFSKFISRTGNVGLTFSKKPVVVMLKWNFRGRQRVQQAKGKKFAPGQYVYDLPRNYFDLNAEYQFTKRVSLFANARNLLNQEQSQERYRDDIPAYARRTINQEFGVQWVVGVKGSF